MPAFGRDEMLDRQQVRNVAAYVYSLGNPSFSSAENVERIEAGREVFLKNCTPCHGEDAKGKRDVGAPRPHRCSAGSMAGLDTIIASVHGGRQGHMPTGTKD